MLEFYRAIPKHSWWRRELYPFFFPDQVKIIILPILMCLLAALLMRDVVVLVPSLTVLYLGFVLSMRRMAPYKMNIPTHDVASVVKALDETAILERCNGAMAWRRKVPFRWMRSNLDLITITDEGTHSILTGRKDDIIVLKRFLGSARVRNHRDRYLNTELR